MPSCKLPMQLNINHKPKLCENCEFYIGMIYANKFTLKKHIKAAPFLIF
jgi:hypothetical protein